MYDVWVLSLKFFKFLMSFPKPQVKFSSNFASFFILMTHNSFVNFKLIHFLFWIKRSHQSSNFENFVCSGENLSNFLYHFPNHKPDFPQILYHYSAPWKITPRYFFRSNVIYFAQKEQAKCRLLRIANARVKIDQILALLKQKISFSWNFESLFSVLRNNSSVLFTFSKSSLSK